jgi:hypothetical protein
MEDDLWEIVFVWQQILEVKSGCKAERSLYIVQSTVPLGGCVCWGRRGLIRGSHGK